MSVVGDINIVNISKSFENGGKEITVLKNVNFTIHKNEFLVLFGPGQCGKSVLMEIIAKLTEPTDGEIVCEDGRELNDEDICMVFQKYALLPWKTCQENVEMPMKFRGIDKAVRSEKAKAYLKLVDLEGFENSYPRQISGGMKQRVAIARAYAKECDLLLFDEPFGALDAQTRYSMENELVKIWQSQKKTIVFITNNIEEAVFLADRIVVLGGMPSSIIEEFTINLPHPRNRSERNFLELRKIVESHAVHSDIVDSNRKEKTNE